VSKPPKKSAIPADKLALYDALIAAVPGLERKGAAMAYTSLNGHMVSYMNADGVLALRLSKPDQEAFIHRHGAKLHEAYGVVQKDYVTVPDHLLADTATLSPAFVAGHRYVGGLKPKPTKKPKAV
jgi:hypothetical protein